MSRPLANAPNGAAKRRPRHRSLGRQGHARLLTGLLPLGFLACGPCPGCEGEADSGQGVGEPRASPRGATSQPGPPSASAGAPPDKSADETGVPASVSGTDEAGAVSDTTEADAAPSKSLEEQLEELSFAPALAGGCVPCVSCGELDPVLCSEQACAAEPCAAYGQCVAEQGRCVAKDDAACRASRRCSELGLCVRRGAVCAATRAEDCQRAAVCRERGLCAAERGVCVAKGDAACRKSKGCALRGECSEQGGECAATRDADCKAAAVCRRHQLCRAVAGRCES
ncbi:MAG: hypothetical protein KF915_16800 [Polyangiaceae bacterium]|nr:hypothetical protein [Polyangiaceae bacterium]